MEIRSRILLPKICSYPKIVYDYDPIQPIDITHKPMPILILQGAALAREAVLTIAHELDAFFIEHGSHYTLRTDKPVAPETLAALRHAHVFDINMLPDNFRPDQVRLLITDMDSTLINIECIDEIADFIGVKPQVSAITAATMRGEINFEASLKKRVALLAGLEASALEHVYNERLEPNPGAEEMVRGLRSAGIKVGLVSGGFTFFTDRLKQRLGLDYARANVLEISDERLTGHLLGKITGAAGKAEFLLELCSQLDIAPHQVVAMGDGANDLDMMNIAGLSIAYHAKPTVQAQAHAVINHGGLECVLGLLDIGN